MPIDELEAKLAGQTWQERVASKRPLLPITELSQHHGNRVISHFYPEHWAMVQLARDMTMRYAS